MEGLSLLRRRRARAFRFSRSGTGSAARPTSARTRPGPAAVSPGARRGRRRGRHATRAASRPSRDGAGHARARPAHDRQARLLASVAGRVERNEGDGGGAAQGDPGAAGRGAEPFAQRRDAAAVQQVGGDADVFARRRPGRLPPPQPIPVSRTAACPISIGVRPETRGDKRPDRRSGSSAAEGELALEQDRDRTVVDELDGHPGAEDATRDGHA
jgi:hypothetical protein